MSNQLENLKINMCSTKELFGNIIYFLWKEEELVYIGSSTTGLYRAYAYKLDKRKDFDAISYKTCASASAMQKEEVKLIIKYLPKYNKNIRNVKYFLTMRMFAILYEITIPEAKELIQSKKIKNFRIGMHHYVYDYQNKRY